MKKGIIKTILSVSLILALTVTAAGGYSGKEKEIKAQETTKRTFVHPGMLHTAESFMKIKKNIENQVQPNLDTWNALCWDGFSAANWNPRPLETVIRGGTGQNFAQFYIDIRRAYQNALIYRINGDTNHGDAAVRILNSWTGNMKGIAGNADRFLAAGIYGYELANAAELMRDYPGFDKAGMEKLLLNVFYPMNNQFLLYHNDAHIGNYWANWDLCNIASMTAIGIFCDREDIYNQAMNYAITGLGNGSIYNSMPYVYEEGLVQWQESCRDQGHSTFGIGLWSMVCEMAWNQGDDLWSLSDNRFLKAAEYVAKYNLGDDVPSSAYEWNKGQNGTSTWMGGVSDAGRGSNRPIYSMIYNHYVNRMGLEAPNLSRVLKNEEGNWNIEGAQGNGDELGWESLTFANLSDRVEKRAIQGDFEDGVYRIRSVLTNKSLVAQENGVLASAKAGTKEEEWWTLTNLGDGEYEIKNVATGQVMQIANNYYSYGCAVNTAAGSNGLNQRFALLKNDTGDYRIIGSVNGFAVDVRDSNTVDDADIIQWRYHSGTGQKWVLESQTELEEKANRKERIAFFSFDNGTDGFSSDDAKAVRNGTTVLGTESKVGKSLKLDGKSYLKVADKKGRPLLSGYEELTISYWSYVTDKNGTNWSFFASSHDNGQTYLQENYLGVIEQNGKVNAQRYLNTGERPADAIGDADANTWNYITISYGKNKTVLYINGKKVSEEASNYALSDILAMNGVFYIGRANWGTGEFYKGYVDEFSVYSYAMDEEKVTETYEDAVAAAAKWEKEKAQASNNNNNSPITPVTKKPTTSGGTANSDTTGQKAIQKNAIYTIGNYKYKVTKATTNGTGTVTLTGLKKKTVKSITVKDTVKIQGVKFKVTAIGAKACQKCKKLKKATVGKNVTAIGNKAFYQCKSLKTIKINSKKLKKVSKTAFSQINKKAVMTVPKGKKKAYKKIIKKVKIKE